MSNVKLERRMGRIPAAVDYSGLSRTRLYELAPSHPGLFRRCGKATLVDFAILDEILENLPHAELRQPRSLAGTEPTAA